MGIVMVAYTYYTHYAAIDFNFHTQPPYFQWKNNLSNNLLISMPFAFYLATKSKHPLLYFMIGILQFFAMFLSFSRGGIIFGSLVFPCVVIACICYTKKARWKFIITTIIFTAVFVYFLYLNMEYFERVMQISGDEARSNMYRLAIEYFKDYPIFGTGLAHDPGIYYRPLTMCIYWYHSTIFQIIASLGTVGLIAYGIQFFYRAKAIFEIKNPFNHFVLFAILGFAGYSMVNVGYFVPVPFVPIVLFMFIILDRNNTYIKATDKTSQYITI